MRKRARCLRRRRSWAALRRRACCLRCRFALRWWFGVASVCFVAALHGTWAVRVLRRAAAVVRGAGAVEALFAGQAMATVGCSVGGSDPQSHPIIPPSHGMQASSPSWDAPKSTGEAAAVEPRGYALVGAFPAHAAAASCLALHPCLPMVATGEPIVYPEACVSIIIL